MNTTVSVLAFLRDDSTPRSDAHAGDKPIRLALSTHLTDGGLVADSGVMLTVSEAVDLRDQLEDLIVAYYERCDEKERALRSAFGIETEG